jgi:hypothetical protein
MQRLPTPATRLLVLPLSLALALAGCATTGTAGAPAAPAGVDPGVLAEYVQKLPPGSAVKVERASRKSIRGTLMKATDQALVVQPRTRVPEPPVEIPLRDVVAVTLDSGGNGANVARAIGIGAAAGAGAALAVFFIILAALD